MQLPSPAKLLLDRCLMRLTGEDRIRYLNGQLTQDVTKACPTEAIPACICSAKGKLEAEIFLSTGPQESEFWLDAPSSLRDSLRERLEKYIVADQVEVEDISADYELWHVLPAEHKPSLQSVWQRSSNRYGIIGSDLIVPAGTSLSVGLTTADPLVWDEHRIARRIPVWGSELNPGLLPQEALLESRAIDFFKGCYIGQETISRIHSIGHVNKRLCLLELGAPGTAAACLRPGNQLFAGEQLVGELTSVSTPHDFDRIFALGFVKKGHGEAGNQLFLENPELSDRIPVRIINPEFE